MAFLGLSCPAFAQSGVATVEANATIYENDTDANGGIYGEVCIGNLAGTGATRRAFVRFEMPDIPGGAIITRVEYNFSQVRARTMCGGCPLTANIELRRVLGDWERGLGGVSSAACGGGTAVPGVNWSNAPSSQASASATEFLSSASGLAVTIDTDVGDDDDGMIDDVQAWADNPASNYGWEYRVLEESTADNARLLNPGSLTIYWGTTPDLDFEDGFESP